MPGFFTSLLKELERENARARREDEKLQRELIRQDALAEKEAQQEYVLQCLEDAKILTEEVSEKILELKNILYEGLTRNLIISFDEMRIADSFREFLIPEDIEEIPPAPNLDEFINSVRQPGFFGKLIPGWDERLQKSTATAMERFQHQKKKYDEFMAERSQKIDSLRKEYEQEKQVFDKKVTERNLKIDMFEAAYHSREPDAVCAYNTMILERSVYPEKFPQEFRIAYLPEPKELVIEYELPVINIIPNVVEYRYIKTRDVIDKKLRKRTEIKDIYQDIVSSICLRTIYEVIEADKGDTISVVTFNGFVQTIDPATGKDIRPYLISMRTTKERFSHITLERVDKRACLRNLGAQVSPNPEEMQAVKPIIDFNMVDKRFVEENDIMADLESRPNLMELNPFEFEHLVSNLFGQMGFVSKLTRSSKDGGIDAIAFDPRPILGGKVVIQAKRYKNVVEVAAVRDLYGTMINEGASKGILVTTSHYGPDAYNFSKDKPIELIDGGGLLYLLEQQGVQARIIFPEDETL
jgi:restriction system protein